MTRVELMIASLLAIILVVMTAGLIFAGSGLFSRTADRNLNDQRAESILELLDKHLRYASEIRILSRSPPDEMIHALAGRETVIYVGDETGVVKDRGRLWVRFGDLGGGIGSGLGAISPGVMGSGVNTGGSGPGAMGTNANAGGSGLGAMGSGASAGRGTTGLDAFGNVFYGDIRIGLRLEVGVIALNRPKTVTLSVDIFRRDGRRVYSKSRPIALVNGITDARLLTGETEAEKLQNMSSPRPADTGDYPPTGESLILAVTEGGI
jgi:hypothetical protein